MGYRVQVELGAITLTPSGDGVGAAGRTEGEVLTPLLVQRRPRRAPASGDNPSPRTLVDPTLDLPARLGDEGR
jgi:hypothetical protein